MMMAVVASKAGISSWLLEIIHEFKAFCGVSGEYISFQEDSSEIMTIASE